MKHKCLILGGADTEWHKFREYRENFLDIARAAGYEAESSENISCLKTEFLRSFSAVISCTSYKKISKKQETALLSSITGFGAKDTGLPKIFIGVHGAAASFPGSDKYLRMLGAKFLAHPPMGTIDVRKAADDEMLDGIDDFRIEDEFYLMEYYPPFKVLLEAEYKGTINPLCWKKSYGLGTVCYLALGHGEEQTSHPVIRTILINMLKYHMIHSV